MTSISCVLLILLTSSATTTDSYLQPSSFSSRECGTSNGGTVRQPRNLYYNATADVDNFIDDLIINNGTQNNHQLNQVGRLINGKESQKGAWPWQVSLQLLHPKFGLITHWCGAVLIFPTWILTAAHCIHNEIFSLRLAALWTAVLGEWNRELDENTEIRIPIEHIQIHENFRNYQHDIALLKLSRAANKMDKTVRTVCLPNGHENNLNTVCIATGWGNTDPDGPLSPILRQIKVPLHSNAICKTKYGSLIPIQPSHLCGGKLDGKFGACIGDSGGPLQCALKDGRWFLAGITSFGSGCDKPGYPDVYTRMSFYIPWIMRQITKYGKRNASAAART